MSKLRVLVVASWFPSPRNPVRGSFIAAQVRALSERFDVAVIAPESRSVRTLIRDGVPGPSRSKMGAVPILRPLALTLRQRNQRAIARRSAEAVVRAYQTLSHEWGVPDLIHGHVVLPGGYAAIALGERINVPVVLTEHSGPFSMHLRTADQRDLVSETLRKCAWRIAVSPSLRDEIRAFLPLPIDIVGNVVDTRFFCPPEGEQSREPGPVRLVFVGLMTQIKGVNTLLEACALLASSGERNWRLRLVGDGPSRIEHERVARRLSLDRHVEFVGLQPPEGVLSALRWSDFLVAPSYHETFGMMAAEALAVGRGVVGTDVGGLRFVVPPESGKLVPPRDHVALAGALREAVTGSLRVDSTRARQSIERRFGEDAIISQLSRIYDSALVS